MNRTITALYASRSDAERAADELRRMGLTSVRVVDAQGASGDAAVADHDRGLWDEIKSWFSDDDRAVYDDSVHRGRALILVDTDETTTARVCEALERTDAIDVDAERGAADVAAAGRASREGEERIPVVEEELALGKRDVARGGARIRSYVRETPAEAQVRLREEHVHVERRPVGEVVTGDAGALFQNRDIEVTERAEEAVVGKRAVVTEEVVVGKDVDERVETVRDSVRRTEVEVDDLGRARTTVDTDRR